MRSFYGDLAPWWPLISPVEAYAEEAADLLRVLHAARPDAKTLLELGAGGGHVASYFKHHYALTLTDLFPEMLAVSAALNPACEHVQGDMRELALGRTFDLVFVHDAIDYMRTEADLDAAIATAARHCRPGGLVLLVPDTVRERFEPGTDCGGDDGDDGRGARYLEWSYDPDPTDTEGITEYVFLLREPDGRTSTVHETHRFGLFPTATWLRLLTRHGLRARVELERTDDDRAPRCYFLGERPA